MCAIDFPLPPYTMLLGDQKGAQWPARGHSLDIPIREGFG
jgi:hypothetical protein